MLICDNLCNDLNLHISAVEDILFMRGLFLNRKCAVLKFYRIFRFPGFRYWRRFLIRN